MTRSPSEGGVTAYKKNAVNRRIISARCRRTGVTAYKKNAVNRLYRKDGTSPTVVTAYKKNAVNRITWLRSISIPGVTAYKKNVVNGVNMRKIIKSVLFSGFLPYPFSSVKEKIGTDCHDPNPEEFFLFGIIP